MDRESLRLRDQLLGNVVFLMIQFLLGVAVNPLRDHPARSSWRQPAGDFSSMLMASLFAVAAVSYAVGLYVIERPASA